MGAILDALLFLGTLGLLFFLPGFLILEAFFPKRTVFVAWEKLLLAFGISVGITDFLMLTLDKLGLALSQWNIAFGLFLTVVTLGSIGWYRQKNFRQKKNTIPSGGNEIPFSSLQTKLFLVLLFLTVFLKIVYLLPLALPTSTDLGHHMYWSKLIAVSSAIPEYAKQEIITQSDGSYALSQPQSIADFIIGEHLPFAGLHIFSRLDFLSAFPVLFLLLINLLGMLALVLLSYRLLSDFVPAAFFGRFFTGTNAALFTLLLFGPLYTLASPQARFVSGGVVGNMLGNFFIPLILLLFFRALREKSPTLLSLGFFFTFTLAYTHHLSTLVLLFVLLAVALVYLIGSHWVFLETLKEWWKILARSAPLILLASLFLFFFLVAVPTYLDRSAIDTALGTPSKTTRTGLSFLQIGLSSGEARLALGVAGMVVLLFFRQIRQSYAGAVLLGWGGILLLMTLSPNLLFIDIPSNRIGSYLSFPLGLLAAWALLALFARLLAGNQSEQSSPLPPFLLSLALLLPLGFTLGSGTYDNGQSLVTGKPAQAAVETYAVSEYLAGSTGKSDVILKDHNYITADAWMKTFFLRDYSYPLSRGLFGRYEDNADREQCTLIMIATPNLPSAQKCFTETGTNYIVINPAFDATQFEKSKNFSRIYSSDTIHVYER